MICVLEVVWETKPEGRTALCAAGLFCRAVPTIHSELALISSDEVGEVMRPWIEGHISIAAISIVHSKPLCH